ncbi:NAD-dependent epimerase/dehydratase family protein [Flavobacterium sp. '19STA2R22 D10 B1']|uniref:NAD-dependent epimerase/dehydratase family protein n=1 Tax=Flavobacterium aerium TaxID=3037261 RepID=UPI00278BD88D|nr:NAD-dependent epimerase/dehydratase family protein [Flavobacterium sp. '19STA2R22 D10 B1']
MDQNDKAIRVIITGTTGMVGEGVLHECLKHPLVEKVLIINRKPLGVTHPKLTEIIHTDFYNLTAIESQLSGYNACFFCLGITSIGISAEDYYKITYTLTMNVATVLSKLNSDMTFCYVSGGGTDSSEKGRSQWARVKGKTENDLMKLPFRQVYAYRPGFIKAIKGLSNTHKFYNYVGWLYPIGRALYPNGFNTLQEVALSMINIVNHGYEKQIIHGKDIIKLAQLK